MHSLIDNARLQVPGVGHDESSFSNAPTARPQNEQNKSTIMLHTYPNVVLIDGHYSLVRKFLTSIE